MLVVVALGCDRSAPAASAAPAPPTTQSFDELASLPVNDPPILPASGNQGDYLITANGIWLLRGTEAVKVREVSQFTGGNPAWLPVAHETNVFRAPERK